MALFYEIIRTKDFNLSFNATYNYNKNNIDKLYDNVLADTHTNWGSSMRQPYYDYIIRVDNPVGVIQGFKSAGIYTVDDFNVVDGVWTLKAGVPDYTATGYAGGTNYKTPDGQTAFPGMAKFEDINGDGVVTSDDATIIGKTMPQHTGGFNFNGNYKNFDFGLGFTYQIGGDLQQQYNLHF